VLVPFVAAIVPSVDIEAGTVTLTPPAGLFDDAGE
jgi:16S rRNA processing protein RimM